MTTSSLPSHTIDDHDRKPPLCRPLLGDAGPQRGGRTGSWRNRSRGDRSASGLVERWPEWCAATASLLIGMYAAEEARLLLESRYLDGHRALFPDATAAWGRLRESAERLTGPGDALRPLMMGTTRSHGSVPDLDLEALRSGARAQALAVAARLVDEARAATLDVMGDVEGASSIAARRLTAIATAARPEIPSRDNSAGRA